MTYDLEQILAKGNVSVDRNISTKSVHLIGSDDPQKSNAYKNSRLF